MTEKQIKRFWSNVKKTRGCWWWVGAKFSNGYGRFWASKEYLAHRASWLLINGSVPKGLHVLHHCDNPSCVRPEHLFLGTQKDNMIDMRIKGRGDKHHYRKMRENWSNNPNRRKEQADLFRATLQKYIYTIDDETNLTYRELVDKNLKNVIGSFFDNKTDTVIFKGHRITRTIK